LGNQAIEIQCQDDLRVAKRIGYLGVSLGYQGENISATIEEVHLLHPDNGKNNKGVKPRLVRPPFNLRKLVEN
jgi:hypothetical protein